MNALMGGLNQTTAVGLAALLNTLWYAAAVVTLTWGVLRYWHRVNAATRYWIWTAVLGFLVVVPFLPVLMTHLEAAQSGAHATVAPLATVSAVPQAVQHLAPVTFTLNSTPGSNPWPLWLLAVWIIAAAWQLTRLLRGAAAVRRLKARAELAPGDGMPIELHRRVRVLASEEINSPVAVGYRRPAVIVPTGLLASLEENERKNVLLHELAHLARYDDWLNLATRALGAILVLHPLAAVVMRQIERQREMACDDFVVAHTGSARNYVRSLARLHDLRLTKGTRLLAPALLGRKASLADRVESLLRHGRGFSARPSLASLGVSAFLLVLLLGASGLMPAWVAIAQTSRNLESICADLPKDFCANLPTAFEVASIKPAKSGQRRSIYDTEPDRGRMWATNIPVEKLILDAYDIKSQQLEGLPRWARWHQMGSRRYTIQAEAPAGLAKKSEIAHKLPPKQSMEASIALHQSWRQMVQSLLAERFKLRVHRATEQLPVYDLVVAKGGPKLKVTSVADYIAAHEKPGGAVGNTGRGYFMALGASMDYLAFGLSQWESNELGRLVINKTGLKGRYDFTLKWSPRAEREVRMNFASNDRMPAPTNTSGPSIFTAIQEQLGLKLKPAKGPVQVLVVDHIEPPTPN